MYTGISCVILAGGLNSRFNNIVKANIKINGKSIIRRMLDTTKGLFNETILVTNTPQNFSSVAEVKIVADFFPEKGPLGGIHAALKASSCGALFVFAGDMPALNRKIIEEEIRFYFDRKCEAVVPRTGKLTEPLHAIYNVSILQAIEEKLINDDCSVREFIKSINTRYFELQNSKITKLAFTNINTPEDKINFEAKNSETVQ